MTLTEAIKQKAVELGFNMVGIVPAVPSKRLNAYFNWIHNAYHGEMGYLARPDRQARRRDLNVILPEVQSIVCVGLDYASQRIPHHVATDPARGRLSNYAWGVDYHDVMTPRLKALGAWLAQQLPDSDSVANRVYVDTGAILERDHAESAGLGFTGKNTMLIDPQRGSWFFLGELLTTVALDYDVPKPMPTCGSCSRCLVACPTNAFPEPHVLDARRCISYLTIELKGWIPRELRPLLQNWIYGCDICQDVCPFNRFAPMTNEPAFMADSWKRAAPPLLELLTLDETGFNARFANSPIKRIKRPRFLRNVCVAVGNWGSETAVSPLITLLQDPSPLVRGHAIWALGRIGSDMAKTAVLQAAKRETDEAVNQEIAMTVAGL